MATRRRSGADAPPAGAAAHGAEAFLSAGEAAQLLRIKPQTLYAYVSRGWIHSIGHDKRRGYLYRRDDIERLRARGQARAEGGLYKGGSARWSEPIVQTSITAITHEGPKYRGHAVLDLARGRHRFESVAELLWSGVWMEEPADWPVTDVGANMDRLVRTVGASTRHPDIVKLFALHVTSLAARADGGDDLREGNTVVAARALLNSLPCCLGYLTPARAVSESGASGSFASRILAAAGVAVSAEAAEAVNATLVLLADHELTPQTFAARLAASGGANLHFCVLSALSAYSGSRIRRACDRVEDLLLAAHSKALLRSRLAELRKSAAIPGFNHPLYPDGDPRAAYKLELARGLGAESRRARDIAALLDEAKTELRARPAVEAGLVALCHALALPYRSAGAILAIARCAGWIAHVIEQRLAGIMLRPRARYLS